MQAIVFYGADKFRIIQKGSSIEGYYAGGFIYIGGFPSYCPDWPNLSLGDKMAKVWHCL